MLEKNMEDRSITNVTNVILEDVGEMGISRGCVSTVFGHVTKHKTPTLKYTI